jgi:hypothetical protein
MSFMPPPPSMYRTSSSTIREGTEQAMRNVVVDWDKLWINRLNVIVKNQSVIDSKMDSMLTVMGSQLASLRRIEGALIDSRAVTGNADLGAGGDHAGNIPGTTSTNADAAQSPTKDASSVQSEQSSEPKAVRKLRVGNSLDDLLLRDLGAEERCGLHCKSLRAIYTFSYEGKDTITVYFELVSDSPLTGKDFDKGSPRRLDLTARCLDSDDRILALGYFSSYDIDPATSSIVGKIEFQEYGIAGNLAAIAITPQVDEREKKRLAHINALAASPRFEPAVAHDVIFKDVHIAYSKATRTVDRLTLSGHVVPTPGRAPTEKQFYVCAAIYDANDARLNSVTLSGLINARYPNMTEEQIQGSRFTGDYHFESTLNVYDDPFKMAYIKLFTSDIRAQG